MSQKQLTILEYALLGLLGMEPATGYDIHKVFATTPLAHFSSSPGAIYPALRRLANIGLLEARLDTTKEARPRRVYHLTEAGNKALTAWLHQPVTREELIRGTGAPILRFSLTAGRLSKEELLSYLETYQKVVAAYLDELLSYINGLIAPQNLIARLSLDHGIRSYRSQLEWTKRAATEIKRELPGSRKKRSSR